jgi:hypothetical protein
VVQTRLLVRTMRLERWALDRHAGFVDTYNAINFATFTMINWAKVGPG